jgi:hypothetical protein
LEDGALRRARHVSHAAHFRTARARAGAEPSSDASTSRLHVRLRSHRLSGIRFGCPPRARSRFRRRDPSWRDWDGLHCAGMERVRGLYRRQHRDVRRERVHRGLLEPRLGARQEQRSTGFGRPLAVARRLRRDYVRARVQRKAVWERRVWRELRHVQLIANVQCERSVRGILPSKLRAQAVRKRWLRRELRHLRGRAHVQPEQPVRRPVCPGM